MGVSVSPTKSKKYDMTAGKQRCRKKVKKIFSLDEGNRSPLNKTIAL